jgi:hypothetical protein
LRKKLPMVFRRQQTSKTILQPSNFDEQGGVFTSPFRRSGSDLENGVERV